VRERESEREREREWGRKEAKHEIGEEVYAF
jgi:hypothetical protein